MPTAAVLNFFPKTNSFAPAFPACCLIPAGILPVRISRAACMEEFGQEIATFLLKNNPQVTVARASISENTWDHLNTHGSPHPTTFVQSSAECQTTEVVAKRNEQMEVRSGLDNLVILKTAGSEFVGYIKDSLTTLPESTDRLFGTAVKAQWTYSSPSLPFAAFRCKILASFSEDSGSICRTFLSAPMHDCHRELTNWLMAAGAEVKVDAAGNLRAFYAAEKSDAPRLLLGSHLDTVPNAGAYDGIL